MTQRPDYLQFVDIRMLGLKLVEWSSQGSHRWASFLRLAFCISQRDADSMLRKILSREGRVFFSTANLNTDIKKWGQTLVSSVEGSKPGNSLVEYTLKEPPYSSASMGGWLLPELKVKISSAR